MYQAFWNKFVSWLNQGVADTPVERHNCKPVTDCLSAPTPKRGNKGKRAPFTSKKFTVRQAFKGIAVLKTPRV